MAPVVASLVSQQMSPEGQSAGSWHCRFSTTVEPVQALSASQAGV
jgi:hypothetical protein